MIMGNASPSELVKIPVFLKILLLWWGESVHPGSVPWSDGRRYSDMESPDMKLFSPWMEDVDCVS